MTAYYNEIDPDAADRLEDLIAAGHIAPGIVDRRSVEDVHPDDLRGFVQCHFFAGFGVWSYALRSAGWPDDRPVWTGSCPCQPFSAAGEGTGFDDERHLWPHFHWLIGQRRPPVVVGEQVASKDAEPWLDLVWHDMEGMAYAFGAKAFPSAGVGAPYIRDRTYWVADARGPRLERGQRSRQRDDSQLATVKRGHKARRLEHAEVLGHDRDSGRGWASRGRIEHQCHTGGLADTTSSGRRKERSDSGRSDGGDRTQGLAAGPLHGGGVVGLAHADGGHAGAEREQRSGEQRQQPQDRGRLRVAPGAAFDADTGAGPTNGLWRDADWLFCRDGRWRPVEPGTFPLAHGMPRSMGSMQPELRSLAELAGLDRHSLARAKAFRVDSLRGYGNAINAEAARIWIECVMDAIDHPTLTERQERGNQHD